jgi:hypothetical protein
VLLSDDDLLPNEIACGLFMLLICYLIWSDFFPDNTPPKTRALQRTGASRFEIIEKSLVWLKKADMKEELQGGWF